MCGIAGAFGAKGAQRSAIERMTQSIAHRGPDGEGIWLDPEAGIGLGNRRLAIIDLSPAGLQPMHSADGRFVLTFNGEIYNHPELRARLESEGQVPAGGWRGHSDTETFLQAIAAWGLGPALERSVGMFAFALWNRRERSLRLVRDRFGEKPLYYGWVGKTLVFASELKGLRTFPGFAADIDRRALSLLASRAYVPAPLSIYRGVFKLPPASILTVETGAAPLADPPVEGEFGGGVGLKSYWSFRSVLERGLGDPIRDADEALDELESVLARSIAAQSLADVPVGAFLSGGIDSSTIVALYQKYSSVPVRTFTIGFADRVFDESADAEAVARHFGTEHHQRMVSASDALEVIPRLPAIYDEPFADSSQIPTFLVSEFARGKVTVALSGDGGDEIFGGYNRYTGLARAWQVKMKSRGIAGPAARALGLIPGGAWRRAAEIARRRRQPPDFGFKMRKTLALLGRSSSLDQFVTAFLDNWSERGSPVLDGDPGPFGQLDFGLGAGASEALRMMHADAMSYLPDDVLVKVDRATMAVGLEGHAPFLDHRVAEFAARLPLELKVRGGQGKWILRRLLEREIPPVLVRRPKAGFSIPLGEWLRGPLREWAESLLEPSRLDQAGWIDSKRVAAAWSDHLSRRRDSSAALWPILMFEAWLENDQV